MRKWSLPQKLLWTDQEALKPKARFVKVKSKIE